MPAAGNGDRYDDNNQDSDAGSILGGPGRRPSTVLARGAASCGHAVPRLAKGQPVDAAQFAEALGVSPSEGRALLARDSIKAFTYPDERGPVVGFGGLAAAPMHHRFEVDGRTLWTWCAWDSLFIPEILGKQARVTSTDPENGELIRLLVSPHRVESA